MELRFYIEILQRRFLVILIVTALASSVVTAAGLFITPIYKAGVTVRVIQDVGVLDLRIRESYGEILMNTYSYVLTSWPVLEQAGERLESMYSIQDLREKVTVEVVPDTELMWITVEDQDPIFAAKLANTLAALLVKHAQSIYTGGSRSALQIVKEQLASMENELTEDRQRLVSSLADNAGSAEIDALKSQIQFEEDSYDRLLDRYELARLNESLRANSITIVSPASIPRISSNAIGLMEIGIGIVVGLSGGLGLALVLENLDTRIHSLQQLEQLTQLPVLGIVPKGLLSPNHFEFSNDKNSHESIEEAYRLLSINVQALRGNTPLKTILVTSAMLQKGKSMVVANLAQVLAERGQTVFLVDSDLRCPIIAEILELGLNDSNPGLDTLLVERSMVSRESLGQIIHPAKQPSLFVINGGATTSNPTALLASPVMDELLNYLSGQGQTTLLDSSPVLGVADVSVLAPRVDGVIIVVWQSQTKREQVALAIKQLQASRSRVMGIVFLKKRGKGWEYG